MSEIKRYSLTMGAISRKRMMRDDCGNYVLHSDHLAAMEAARAQDKAEIERLRAQIKKYRARLEIDHDWIGDEFGHFTRVECDDDLQIDGIACRDETIKQLDTRIAELEAKVKQTDSLFNDAEAVRRDAAHHRWLRAHANPGFTQSGKPWSVLCSTVELRSWAGIDREIDAAIDAAREKK